MTPLSYVPFATPAEWITKMVDVDSDEVMDFVPDITPSVSISSISYALEVSNDADTTMSIYTLMKYKIHINTTSESFFKEIANDLSESRLYELMSMRVDVMRECVSMLKYLDNPPSPRFLIKVGDFIKSDPSAIERLVNVWDETNWLLAPELVFIIQNSYSAWKLIRKINNENKYNSRTLLQQIIFLTKERFEIWLCVRALLGTNGSCLEYLMHIDDANIEQTINTINGFELWDIVLSNPAAQPIIDRILENEHLVKFKAFNRVESLRQWLIPRISSSPLVEKYMTIDDIESNKVGRLFFKNPYSINLISKWINQYNITSTIIDGLVEIASSHNEKEAIMAINIIDSGYDSNGIELINTLSNTQWASLIVSPYARTYAKNTLLYDDLQYSLINVVRSNNIVPRWVSIFQTEEFQLINLNVETIKNIDLDNEFFYLTSNYVEFLSYADWSMLLKTEIGVSIAIDNIGYVIDKGLFFELLGSEFLSKDAISDIQVYTDAFEYAGDEEFMALICRHDAYRINFKMAFEHQFSMCQELLMAWFEPSRLKRIAQSYNMDMRSYLNSM